RFADTDCHASRPSGPPDRDAVDIRAGMPRGTVFLFDIDGTLLLTGGAGRRAFEQAFADVCGRPDACNGFSFAGMTDRAIARKGLLSIDRRPDAELIDRLIDA